MKATQSKFFNMLIRCNLLNFSAGFRLLAGKLRTHRLLPMEENLIPGKELINLFEGQIFGLWIEEVDERQEACVEDYGV
jgi:hypothetical protein